MLTSTLDPFRLRPSLVHRTDPRVKLLLAVAGIITVSLVPAGAWPIYVLLLSLAVAMTVLSELDVWYVWRRSALVLPFVLAAVPLLFLTPGDPIFPLHLGAWDLSPTWPGVERTLSIALKSWISVQLAILLAATTQFPALLAAMRALGMPQLLVAIVGLMWRYLFVLVDEAMRLMRARNARSASPCDPRLRPGGTWIWRARVTGGMVGNLFLRSYDRADRVYAAMTARGYDGEIRTVPMSRLRPPQWGVVIAGFLLLISIVTAGVLFWG